MYNTTEKSILKGKSMLVVVSFKIFVFLALSFGINLKLVKQA